MIFKIIWYCILVILIYIIQFQLNNSFWRKQPVFHKHNVFYWLTNHKIIQSNDLPHTKYYDLQDYSLMNPKTLTKTNWKDIHWFIQNHYLNEEDISYNPSLDTVISYFKRHNQPCYIASYSPSTLLITNKLKIINYPKIKAFISSRPLNVKCNNVSKNIITNYVDFLCTHKKERKKGITPKLIYTFAKTVKNSNIQTFLFKRENETQTIVPLTTFSCFVFDTTYWKCKPHHPIYKLSIINGKNINYLLQHINLFSNSFYCVVIPTIEHLIYLIEKHIYTIFILHYEDDIIAYFIFKNNNIVYKNKNVYECIGSWCKKNSYTELFINNFYNCIDYLKNTYDNTYIAIENVSHNNILLTSIRKDYHHLTRTIHSYYFYNYIIHTYYSNECLLYT